MPARPAPSSRHPPAGRRPSCAGPGTPRTTRAATGPARPVRRSARRPPRATACGSGPECSPFIPNLENGKYTYDLGINPQDYRKILGNTITISVSGYEVYEKNGSTYTKVFGGAIGNPELDLVSVNPGEKKVYVARVYVTKADGTKIYSNYSNEIVIDHTN